MIFYFAKWKRFIILKITDGEKRMEALTGIKPLRFTLNGFRGERSDVLYI